MRKKITAAFAALALAVTSLFVATSASAIQGDDPSNPIILTSLDDVPAGAVSTGSHMRQCSTVQTWSLTIPGDALIEHPEYRYLREVPAVEEVSHQEYQWSIASRTYNPGQTELTHQVYSYEQVVPTYQTQYQYQMQVQGYAEAYVIVDHGSWPSYVDHWGWVSAGTFGWEWWNGGTTQWSFSDVAVLYSGPHSAIQYQDSQYRKITTAYQFVKNGNAQQVQVGTHMEYTGETTSVLGSPWTLLGGYPHTVIDRPYIAPSFTPWVWSSYTPWQTLTTPPADPDGQDGEANPLNLRKITEGGPGVYEQKVITTPAAAAYNEYFVYGGPPSLIEANASWVSATQSPSGWVRFDTRVVVDQEATPDVVTYYEYSNGVQCSVRITDATTCGEFDVTVSHNTPWRYGVTVEFDGADMGDSVVVIGPGSETLSFVFDEDEFDGEITGRYYVTDATEWDYVPADLQVARPYGSNIGTAFREFTVNTDCAPNHNPGSPSVSVVQTCGEVELTFTNDVVLGYNEYATPASFSYTDADRIKRDVIVEPNGEPVVVTVSFPEDSGPQQVTYWEPTGDRDGTTLNVETNCKPDSVTVNFDLTGIPPTCSADGGLPGLPETEGYSLAWDREFDGPGTYTLTATADTGYVIEGQTSKDFTVEAATGYQNEDPEVACYVEPPTKDDLVTVVDGTFACNDTTVKTTTTTISYTFTFDSETGTYSAPIAGKPVVVEGVRDLKATERTVCSVPPVPPTLATTGLDTVGVMFGMIGILGLGIMVLAGAARLRRSRQEG